MPRAKRQNVLKKHDTARRSVVEVADLSRDTDDAVSEAEDESEPHSVSLRTVLSSTLEQEAGLAWHSTEELNVYRLLTHAMAVDYQAMFECDVR
jgi:hypothetical protein